ncbi:MAG: hypothetical protein ACI9YT_000969, partial [Halobacteriales archaeon]
MYFCTTSEIGEPLFAEPTARNLMALAPAITLPTRSFRNGYALDRAIDQVQRPLLGALANRRFVHRQHLAIPHEDPAVTDRVSNVAPSR